MVVCVVCFSCDIFAGVFSVFICEYYCVFGEGAWYLCAGDVDGGRIAHVVYVNVCCIWVLCYVCGDVCAECVVVE